MSEIAETVSLTPTERRLFNLLSDGKPHHEDKLVTLLNDELGARRTVRVHICGLRKKISDKKLAVIGHRIYGKLHYQMVQLLP